MRNDERPAMTFKCRCGKPMTIEEGALMGPIKIRIEDLRPRLERLSEALCLCVGFAPQLSPEYRDLSLLNLDIDSFTALRCDLSKTIQRKAAELCSALDPVVHKDSNGASVHPIGPHSKIIIAPVRFIELIVGWLWVGPFYSAGEHQFNPEDSPLPELPIRRVEELRKHVAAQAHHLKEVFWRRAGDVLRRHVDLLAASPVEPNSSNPSRGSVMEEFSKSYSVAATLLRQGLLVEGAAIFTWSEERQLYVLECNAGTVVSDEAWQAHNLSEPSLVRAAQESEIAHWATPRGNPAEEHNLLQAEQMINRDGKQAHDSEHGCHPLLAASAQKLRGADPALAAIAVIFNPLRGDGTAAERSELQARMPAGNDENDLPPVGRQRFDALVWREVHRLLDLSTRKYREALTSLFISEHHPPNSPSSDVIATTQSVAHSLLEAVSSLAQARSACVQWPQNDGGYGFAYFPIESNWAQYWQSQELKPTNGYLPTYRGPHDDRPSDLATKWIMTLPGPGSSQALLGLAWTDTLPDRKHDLHALIASLSTLRAFGGLRLWEAERTEAARRKDGSVNWMIATLHQALTGTQAPVGDRELSNLIARVCTGLSGLLKRRVDYCLVEDWLGHTFPSPAKGDWARIVLRRNTAPQGSLKVSGNASGLDELRIRFETTRKRSSYSLDSSESEWFDLTLAGEPGWALPCLVEGKLRGLLVVFGANAPGPEYQEIVELVAGLLARSVILLLLRTEIALIRSVRSELRTTTESLHAAAADALEFVLGKMDGWPGLCRAGILWRAPWERDGYLWLARGPKGNSMSSSIEGVPASAIYELEGVNSAPLKLHRALLAPLGPRDTSITKLVEQLPPGSGDMALVVPLVGQGERLGWLVGTVEGEQRFSIVRRAEVLCRELFHWLGPGHRWEEQLVGRSMIEHSLRNRLLPLGLGVNRMRRELKKHTPVFATVLQNLNVLDEGLRELARRLDKQQTLARLIRSTGRDEASKAVGTHEKTNLLQPLRKLIPHFRDVGRRRGANISVTIEPPPHGQPIVRGSEEALTNIFENLMDNAIKFSYRNRTILVRVEGCENTGWRVVIKNEGKPIPKVVQERVGAFQRDGTLDPTRGTIPGHGLGLAVVLMISRALDATFEMKTEDPDASCTRNTVTIHFRKS